MRIINKSSFDTKFVKEALRFAKPRGVRLKYIKYLHINDVNDCRYDCSAYISPNKTENTVSLGLNPKQKPPYNTLNDPKHGYLPTRINNYEELIIWLLAHESRHIWQAHVSEQSFSKRGVEMIAGSTKSKFKTTSSFKEEKDACEYATRKLETYREKGLKNLC